MFTLLQISIGEALRTLRGNLFRTLLSTLGIIIGVAALTAILALGDGMEAFGRRQVSGTTDLNTVFIEVSKVEEVDGMVIKKENFPVFTLSDVDELENIVSKRDTILLQCSFPSFIRRDTHRRPAMVVGTTPASLYAKNQFKLAHGRLFDEGDMLRRDSVALLSHLLAKRLASDSNRLDQLLDDFITVGERRVKIIGILSEEKQRSGPKVLLPFFLLKPEELEQNPPFMAVVAEKVELVPSIKTKVTNWIETRFGAQKKDIKVFTYELRVDQLKTGILVFKLVMGMIVGISILVGGIGVMNVLLMSVTERTREIGVRKAMGAKRRVIALQFLAESLAVSVVGSLLGMLLGMLFLMIAVPIIYYYTQIDFPILLDPGSIGLVLLIALVIGLVFGTYPARKASKLSPIDAIRYE